MGVALNGEMRGSYPTQRGSSTLDPPRSRPRAAFELPLGRRRSHTYATGENQQNASLKCPARVAQLDRIARGKQAGARAPGHLGSSASGGQLRTFGRLFVPVRGSADVLGGQAHRCGRPATLGARALMTTS